MALTKAAIVAGGLEILARYGLADLTMRRLAEELGVQAGALYYHVPNKQQLLAALADELLRPVGADDLRVWADEYRATLLSCRDGAELVASSRALGLGAADPWAGLRGVVSEDLLAACEHFILGATMHDQTQRQLLELGVIPELDAEAAERRFRVGVELFVAAAKADPSPRINMESIS